MSKTKISARRSKSSLPINKHSKCIVKASASAFVQTHFDLEALPSAGDAEQRLDQSPEGSVTVRHQDFDELEPRYKEDW